MQSLDIKRTHGTFHEEVILHGPTYKKRRSFNFPAPSECPRCHKAIDPVLHHIDVDNSGRNIFTEIEMYWVMYAIFHCPACSFPFYAEYAIDEKTEANSGNPEIITIGPVKHQDFVFSESILNLSPDFCKIYNQSLEAEENNLDEISGPGYRKALEYLVKDFAISRNTELTENIQAATLSSCINQYIDNRRIKTLAEKCAWIGNDLTHYTRKHENLTVDDLKRLINATVSFIDSELQVDFAEAIQRK